jgi:hypothetical protein
MLRVIGQGEIASPLPYSCLVAIMVSKEKMEMKNEKLKVKNVFVRNHFVLSTRLAS